MSCGRRPQGMPSFSRAPGRHNAESQRKRTHPQNLTIEEPKGATAELSPVQQMDDSRVQQFAGAVLPLPGPATRRDVMVVMFRESGRAAVNGTLPHLPMHDNGGPFVCRALAGHICSARKAPDQHQSSCFLRQGRGCAAISVSRIRRSQGFFRIIKNQRGGGSPKTPSPPPQTKVTIVGKNEIYKRENLVRPFLVHQVLGPKPPAPLPPPAQKKPWAQVMQCNVVLPEAHHRHLWCMKRR